MRKPKWDEVRHEWLEFTLGSALCALCGQNPSNPIHQEFS